MDISNVTALITGANRGIGRALVAELHAAGAKRIYATARSLTDAEGLRTPDERVKGVVLDVNDKGQIAGAAARLGDVNLLINNAGVLDFGNFLTASREQIDRNFATNFFGPLEMTKAFAPVITANGGGVVVNMLTLVALASMPGLSVYNASKAAAWSMTQSLRATLAPMQIKVMGVFPGAVDTDMIADIDMPKTAPAAIAKAIVAGLVAGTEDVFPDAMSASVYDSWKADHKAVERQFATM
ncbi:SDR family oxidoreductase [Devosia sp.]|uniref:SDR family oxidoreductase n=1 Tax=Devosia sp. TaxID=1871048 RepID=UPI003BA90D89